MIHKLICFMFICNIQFLSGNDPAEKTPDSSENFELRNESNVCKNSQKNCSSLDITCMECNFTTDCIYGENNNITCNIVSNNDCQGEKTFQKTARCQYCYQTEKWEHRCEPKNQCLSVASPPQYYITNCTVHGDVMCLGNRKFPKKLRCNWTRGHKWSTALILSITLGGFGADRFYLGHWQEGIGKLFSFGGLGVWTLVDVLLIAIRYLGPADGSFYV